MGRLPANVASACTFKNYLVAIISGLFSSWRRTTRKGLEKLGVGLEPSASSWRPSPVRCFLTNAQLFVILPHMGPSSYLVSRVGFASSDAEIAALAAWGSSSFKVLDAVYTVMFGVSLIVAFLWSLFFEPASHRFDVRLTQSAMRNEYYKSRNAMAYYGPAVVNAEGEIDIAAAAQQAQACLSCTPC